MGWGRGQEREGGQREQDGHTAPRPKTQRAHALPHTIPTLLPLKKKKRRNNQLKRPRPATRTHLEPRPAHIHDPPLRPALRARLELELVLGHADRLQPRLEHVVCADRKRASEPDTRRSRKESER